LSLRSPSEFTAHLAAVFVPPDRSRSSLTRHPLMRFPPLQRFPAQGSGAQWLNFPGPTGLRLQVFSTSWRFCVRPEPASLISCWIRSWGSPFRALLLSCSRTPFPTPFPSCRSKPDPTAFTKSLPCALAETETPEQQLPSNGLQQAPSPSGLCSTRESATSLRLFRPPGARSSPGIHPLQGFLPHRHSTTFIAPPLLGLPSEAIARSIGRPFRVFLRRDSSSRKRDRLPS
jgi:hypothetical protein